MSGLHWFINRLKWGGGGEGAGQQHGALVVQVVANKSNNRPSTAQHVARGRGHNKSAAKAQLDLL